VIMIPGVEDDQQNNAPADHNWSLYSIIQIIINWLVVLTILKNMKVNGKDYPIYEMDNKKCSKPPTS
jgi:hypothetical protein